jgi:adenylate cyclase
VEIERKFLVPEPPDLTGTDSVEVEQGYLALADPDGGAEVRLRRRGNELVLTIKGGTGRSRAEQEIDLDRAQFEALWPLTAGRRVAKKRHMVPLGELVAELDLYKGDLDGLVVVEVEFDDDAAADEFEPPAWFGAEVTGKQEYLNETLATKGMPR